MKGKQILIIDDDKVATEPFARRLEKRGFSVALLHDSNNALETIAEKRPDLVLLDIMMPGLSGIDVLKAVRQTQLAIELPVVMMTARDESSDITECLKLGANDYLTKPVDIEVALARINTQLTLIDLNRANIQKKQLETLNAMIITYNHQINNPLTAAIIGLGKDVTKLTQERLEAANQSLDRIADIVRNIEQAVNEIPELEEYINGEQMIKLD